MLELVAATIARYQMWQPGQRVGVAVSGGADSVCLLHVLRELAPRWDLRLRVLHLNHRLRGRESDEDAEFVRRLAGSFGMTCIVREAEVAKVPGNLEEAAREARLAFFQEAMDDGEVNRVAVGHTRSDQAETVLFRFLRGAGTGGLAGIRPVTKTGIVRPLISVDRAAVEQFLNERGIPWREDSTNRHLQFARNRIRHELLPCLEREWNPAMVRTLAQTADWALAEEAYWEAEIDRLAAEHLTREGGAVLLRTGSLARLPLAAARRLVRRAMEQVRGDLRAIDFAHIQAVLEMASTTEGHGRLQAPDLDVMRSFDWLRFGKVELNRLETRNYHSPVAVPGVTPIPASSAALSLELVEKSNPSEKCECVYNGEMVCVDWERLSGSLNLRNWRPGDQYQPAGSTGEQKIKTLFQEFRIPLWERRHWPVLLDGNSIVWSRRFGPAARFTVGPETRKILTIREIGIGRRPEGVYYK
ncbi:MAG: tRNA lysidine(34) synthetase TilS [Terriglobia bacterium]|nr:MAG: tRNA lysidine(34) synthetase TilS [Terriglobia bacterium]